MSNIKATKSSEPLGVAFTLGDLSRSLAHAVDVYGPDTRICGDNSVNGLVMHMRFPVEGPPYATFTHVEKNRISHED